MKNTTGRARTLLVTALTTATIASAFTAGLALAAELSDPSSPSPTPDTPAVQPVVGVDSAGAPEGVDAASEKPLGLAAADEAGLTLITVPQGREFPEGCSSYVEVVDKVEGYCLDELGLDLQQRWELGQRLRGMQPSQGDLSEFRAEMKEAGEAG
jgi:hypothetical protein